MVDTLEIKFNHAFRAAEHSCILAKPPSLVDHLAESNSSAPGGEVKAQGRNKESNRDSSRTHPPFRKVSPPPGGGHPTPD